MLILILGLILFLGIHSVRIFAEDWRNAQITKRGSATWLGLYSLVSIIGFLLILWGYRDARLASEILWYPPVWTKHLAALLTLPAFIFFVSFYIPGSKIKSIIGNPMIVSVKLWATAHLISNGAVVDIILFTAFLLWAILDFRTARRRDKAAGVTYEFVSYGRDVIAIIVGSIVWAVFAMYLHGMWIGVKPFG
jgi:uncharacterized membrane protein